MAGWLTDVRLAVRHMGTHRGITAAALLSLALTTGLGTALFSLFNAIALVVSLGPARTASRTEAARALND